MRRSGPSSEAERMSRLRHLAVLAMVALLLAAAGLYGSLTHASGRRKRELGTRMAIGAERGGVLLLVLKECAYRVPDF